MRSDSAAPLLDGIRVLDLTRLLPGPLCTLHLADMGADVVKIEDPRRGDYARGGEYGRDARMAAFFRCVNRNKRGLKLDLSRAAGGDVLRDLARGADVLVEGFRPGVMDRLGVGFDALHEVNPRLVYCAISGYGQSGPYRDRAGHDINYTGYAGVGDQVGREGGGPALSNFQIADLAGGTLSAAMGILAALVAVSRGGPGRLVDVSMTDCTLAHAVTPFAPVVAEGATPERGRDLLTGGLPCYGYYETRDGRWLAVGALEAKFWRNLCEALGRPDLAERRMVYGAEAEEVRAEVAAVFRTRTRAEWCEALEALDCCVSPVLTLGEAMADPQLRARGMIVEGGDGRPEQLALPVKFSEFDFRIARSAPGHGEHSREILRQTGYDEARIDALAADGVI